MIHHSAIVDPGAELGTDVDIGPFCVIEAGARIGDGCRLGRAVGVHRGVTLGAGCRVHAGAALGDEPQDRNAEAGESYVKIGARCIVREGVTVHRGTKAGSVTEIGDDCFLMAYSHCAHNVKLGSGVILANGALLAGYVQVGAKAFLSGNSVVHQFVKIGRLAMLGGGCGASKDVPPFCTVRPITLNKLAGLNVVGLRRAGFTAEDRDQVKRAFTILYRSGLNVSQAAAKIREVFAAGPALEFCAFIEASERGLCSLAGGE